MIPKALVGAAILIALCVMIAGRNAWDNSLQTGTKGQRDIMNPMARAQSDAMQAGRPVPNFPTTIAPSQSAPKPPGLGREAASAQMDNYISNTFKKDTPAATPEPAPAPVKKQPVQIPIHSVWKR